MEQSVNEALSILIVGMVTVFFILWLVVLIGNVIIRVTNKYWPALETVKSNTSIKGSSDGTVAAIVAAVDIVTKGKGRITKIKKV